MAVHCEIVREGYSHMGHPPWHNHLAMRRLGRVPERISITITAEGSPLEGIPVMLRFEMAQKNHHSFVFGPSDVTGKIDVSADEIRREAHKTMELFLMDYAEIEAHWTGRLQVTPMNREAVKRALSAYHLFRRYEFPPGYEEMLHRADAILSQMPGAKLDARVHCETGTPLTVEIVSADA